MFLRHALSPIFLRLLALTLPMLPGVIAAWRLEVYRPWFWAEFLLLAVLARGRSWLFALGLAALWLADYLFIFAQIILSSDYGDALELLRFLPYSNRGWIAAAFAGVAALSLWGWLCVRAHRLASPGRGLLLWSLLLVGITVAWPARDGFNHAEGKLYTIRQAKLSGSWALDSLFMRESLAFFEYRDPDSVGQFGELPPEASAVGRLLSKNPPPDKVLIVVMESWGVARDPEENRFWQQLWASPSWSLSAGVLPSVAATVQAEFRELCGLFPHSLFIETIPKADKCLPNMLRAQGWRTQAFHGASSRMYRRDHWYPLVGFDYSAFFQQLKNESVKCFNIPGACDYSIAHRVAQTLRDDGKQFTYWLTLNSHTPYSASDLSMPALKDQVCHAIKLEGARCAHAALIHDFMQSLKTELEREPIPGLEVILVGDHGPHFFDAASREQFSAVAVPYIGLSIPGRSMAASKAD